VGPVATTPMTSQGTHSAGKITNAARTIAPIDPAACNSFLEIAMTFTMRDEDGRRCSLLHVALRMTRRNRGVRTMPLAAIGSGPLQLEARTMARRAETFDNRGPPSIKAPLSTKRAARHAIFFQAPPDETLSPAPYVDVRRTLSARGPFGPSPTSNSTLSPSRRLSIVSPQTALPWKK
jgi:hypothetical protein